MNKLPKLKLIGENTIFPWKLGDYLNLKEISFLEEKMHRLIVDGTMYIMEINKFGVNNNSIFIEGFLTDNTNVGIIAFELDYE